MKYVLALSAALVLLGSATVPTLAACPGTSTHYADAAVSPECLIPDTKAKHPGWYRDGGYCDGATSTTNVTGFSQGDDCEEEE